MYRCGKCGEIFNKLPEGLVRCPSCAYRVIYKVRAPVAKTIKAR